MDGTFHMLRWICKITVLINLSSCMAQDNSIVGVVFIRHGESMWQPTMLDLGPQDLPLSDLGRSQACLCADILKQFSDIKIEKIYASPLKRAQETACVISEVLNIPIVTEKDLEERYFGDFRLLADKDICSQMLPPDAESIEAFTTRVLSSYEKISRDGGVIAIISHEKVFECLSEYLCASTTKIHMGQAYFFQKKKDGWILVNITSAS